MHILIAPNPQDIPLHIWPGGESRHEVLQLANRRPLDGDSVPANSWKDLLSRCPEGWAPEAFFCWSIEYRPVPEGIEDADCFTVGVVGDWNLGGQALHEIGGAFDLLVADQNGCDRLRQAGHENVLYWPLWGYDPQRHFPLPGVERDLDIVTIGNFNHHIQWERAPWLARVARLSRKYRVLVGNGIFGEEYTRAMSRAKIVFNRSIRGEINMRAYEAAACGALLFYERENREIGNLFRDGEECVLYDDGDLEDLLAYYLQNEPERNRIAENARRKVLACTYAEQAAGLFDRVEIEVRNTAGAGRVNGRRFASLSKDERALRRVRQWLTVAPGLDAARAEVLLSGIEDLTTDAISRYTARACLLGLQAGSKDGGDVATDLLHEAVELCRWRLRIDPRSASVRANCGEMLLAMGDDSRAEAEFSEALCCLRNGIPATSQVDGPYFPRAFDGYTVEMERIWTQFVVGSTDWRRHVGELLSWRCRYRLSEIAQRGNRMANAVDHAKAAVSLRPEHATTWQLLARCHREAGQLPEAATAYRRAYELIPLDADTWLEWLACLSALGAASETRTLCDDLLATCDGCPNFAPLRSDIEQYLSLANEIEPVRTLLAAPDWSRPEFWQPVVAEFARSFRLERDATLAMLVDPEIHPDLDALIPEIERLLETLPDVSGDQLPDLHLIHGMSPRSDPSGTLHSIDAVCPLPECRIPEWLSTVPRMTVRTFHLAFHARRPRAISKAA